MAQIVKAEPGIMIVLGKEGEHQARSVEFDLSEWRAAYGPGTVQLLVRRSGEELPYPVEITQEETRAVWTVNETELARPGMGCCKLRYYQGETLVKSEVWLTFVLDGAADTEDPPAAPDQNWLERMLRSEIEIKEAAEEVRQAARLVQQAVDVELPSGISAAQQACSEAQAARQAVENMSVSAETLEPGQDARVTKRVEDDGVHLHYGIPAGAEGRSAYACAQDAGYLGTEEEFAQKLAVDYIDWFGRGISIPKGADLNDYKTYGKYYVNSESLAQTLLNCPTTTNFAMFVFERTANIFSQLIIALNGKMYIRSANSKTWRAWVAYTTSEEIEELTRAVKEEIVADAVQADWDQNDETAADYIRNRPFYSGDAVHVKEQAVATDENGFAFADGTFIPTVGQTYQVIVDSVAYNCEAWEFDKEGFYKLEMPTILLGNLDATDLDPEVYYDNGGRTEPFALVFDDGKAVGVYISEGLEELHTVSVKGKVEVKLDRKYLDLSDYCTRDEMTAYVEQTILGGAW